MRLSAFIRIIYFTAILASSDRNRNEDCPNTLCSYERYRLTEFFEKLCCGRQEKAPTPMELLNNNHTFNLKQREMFAKLLAQAKERVHAELESDYAVNQRVEDELFPKLAEEHGASELIADVRRLTKELDDAKTALRKIGFSCDEDGGIGIHYEAPKALREALETAQRSARKERDNALKKYDKAILEVWASDDASQAKKIVEGLL